MNHVLKTKYKNFYKSESPFSEFLSFLRITRNFEFIYIIFKEITKDIEKNKNFINLEDVEDELEFILFPNINKRDKKEKNYLQKKLILIAIINVFLNEEIIVQQWKYKCLSKMVKKICENDNNIKIYSKILLLANSENSQTKELNEKGNVEKISESILDELKEEKSK